MAAIFQMTFWNKFSCMKIVAFQLTFTEIDSQAANQQQTSIRSNNGLAPVWCQAIIWTKGGLVYWHIYDVVSLDEFTKFLCDQFYWVRYFFFAFRSISHNPFSVNSLRAACFTHCGPVTSYRVIELDGTSHYLNQCWPFFKGVLWHSHESNCIRNAYELTVKSLI